MLHLHLCSFQIAYGMKQFTTNNHSLNGSIHMIYVPQPRLYQNIAKLLTHTSISHLLMLKVNGGGTYISLQNLLFWLGLGDQVSISGWVIPKIQKVVLDTSLLNSQHYKVRFKGKVEQSREWSSLLSYTSV